MKYLIIFVSLFALSACGLEEGSDVTNSFTAVCIDDVQYWIAGIGSAQMMAPRVDSETLTFVRCEGK